MNSPNERLPLIAVIRGGLSGESVISFQSADRMMKAIDRARFAPVLVTLGAEGWSCATVDEAPLPFDPGTFRTDRGNGMERIDAALIAIHGTPGEDGKLQGYLDLQGVPYQTGGVLNMALTFSKSSTTGLLRQLGFTVAPGVVIAQGDPVVPEHILKTVGLPCFVKPDESGSSLGISKVKSAEALLPAIEAAFKESHRVLVEGAVSGRELTCGVLGMDGEVKALPVCEIRTSHEFFDYQAKYHAKDTEELVPAPLPDEVTRMVQERSAAIFRALDCRGMARVDHFWSGTGTSVHDLVTIEVNTTPGFSGASIYPKMLEVSGIGVPAVVNGLIAECLQRGR
ncbi:MAG: D-alanine--D-alanine ligase [Flavobacteriales bacterium]|nr:D-alanine--D-alanine ligase [Flavobacteriales bacterium]